MNGCCWVCGQWRKKLVFGQHLCLQIFLCKHHSCMTYAGELPSSPSLCTINTNCRLQTVYHLCLRWHIGSEMRCEMLLNCHKIDCSTATGGGITNLKQRPSGRFQIDSHSSHWQRSDIVTGTPRDHWHWQLSIVHNDVETMVDTVVRPEFESLCRSLGRVSPSKRAEDKSRFPALIKRSSLQFLFSDVTASPPIYPWPIVSTAMVFVGQQTAT